MKKYDYLFLSFGLLFSFPPIYKFFGWIYIWNSYPKLTHLEKVVVYDTEILYNFFDDRYTYALLALLSGVIAGTFLLLSLRISHNNNNKFLIPKLFFNVINGICTFSIIWSLM